MEIAYQTLSQVINNVLKLDPDMLARLQHFNGKTLAVEFTNAPLKFYVALAHDGVQLLPQAKTPPAATIKGSLFTLGALAWQDISKTKSMFGSDVEFSGDVEFAQAVKQAFDQLDIDWEEWLSGYVGDVLSHEISSVMKNIVETGNKIGSSLQADLSEFLTEEARLTPSPAELDDFYHDIATMRDDVERFEAKVQQFFKEAKQ